MTIKHKIEKKIPSDINREAARISAISSGKRIWLQYIFCKYSKSLQSRYLMNN